MEDPSEIAEARQALVPPACELWPPLRTWRVTGVRSGVRALPSRTPQGAMPYAGRVDGGHPDRRCGRVATFCLGCRSEGDGKQGRWG